MLKINFPHIDLQQPLVVGELMYPRNTLFANKTTCFDEQTEQQKHSENRTAEWKLVLCISPKTLGSSLFDTPSVTSLCAYELVGEV